MLARLHTKASDCEYHEYNYRLTEQFILGLDNEVMIFKVLRKLTVLKDINGHQQPNFNIDPEGN